MYKLDFSTEGRRSLASLDKEIGQRILDKIKWLIQNIEVIPLLPLRGKYSGLFKLKVGDWRVIYEINHSKRFITVHKIGHRREIYKRQYENKIEPSPFLFSRGFSKKLSSIVNRLGLTPGILRYKIRKQVASK